MKPYLFGIALHEICKCGYALYVITTRITYFNCVEVCEVCTPLLFKDYKYLSERRYLRWPNK